MFRKVIKTIRIYLNMSSFQRVQFKNELYSFLGW